MKVVATSDWHGELPDVPECDLLLIGGDQCPVRGPHLPHEQRNWMKGPYKDHLERLSEKCGAIVEIAGNHDFVCEWDGWGRFREDNGIPGTYLEDDAVTVGGLKVYGSPWVPNLPSWAFYATDQGFEIICDEFPDDADILLLHGPPYGVRDYVAGAGHVGGPTGARILEVQPKLVVCGHIHEGYGSGTLHSSTRENVKVWNVSHMNEYYEPTGRPVELEV